MKLKKWIKYLDPIVDITIWLSNSSDNEPAYKGSLMDMPYMYTNLEIGRTDKNNPEEPIYVGMDEETKRPTVVINLIDK